MREQWEHLWTWFWGVVTKSNLSSDCSEETVGVYGGNGGGGVVTKST